MSIEILNYKEINKGSLKSSFDLKIPSWGLIIRNCSCFEKNGKSWVSMPSKKYEKDGETKYYGYVVFEKDVKEKLDIAVKEKLDEIKNNISLNEQNKKEF